MTEETVPLSSKLGRGGGGGGGDLLMKRNMRNIARVGGPNTDNGQDPM